MTKDQIARGTPRDGSSRLKGKPLATRGRFLAVRSLAVLSYLVLLAAALFAAISLEQWLFTGLGVTALAVLAAIAVEVIGEGLFEIPKAFSYRRYRDQWERANPPPSDSTRA